MKKNDIAILLTFISFLFIPTFVYWIIKSKMDLNNYENRTLYSRPEFTFENIASFPSDYEKYFNDKLPFKNEIRKLRSLINYKIFNISSNERVIIGKNDWFFYDSLAVGDGDSISDYRNNTIYSNDEINEIETKIYSMKEKLKQKNIDLYIFVAPNKEIIYSEYLEDIVNKKNNSKSRTEDLIEKINEKGNVNIIYPKEELISNKKNHETYFKYDTHWNFYGAYIGVKKIMEYIDSDFMMPYESINYSEYGGDLANMNLMTGILNKEPNVSFMNDITVNCDNQEINYCQSNGLKDQKIMVIGDSFSNLMTNYFSKIYSNSIFVKRVNYHSRLIDIYKPDIIVYEVVERYSYELKTIDCLTN